MKRPSQAKTAAIAKVAGMACPLPASASMREVVKAICGLSGKLTPTLNKSWELVIEEFVNGKRPELPPMKPLSSNYLKFQRARLGEYRPGYTNRLKEHA